MSVLLSSDERRRFAEWLENEAANSKATIELLKKLDVSNVHPLVARERSEMAAALLIARKLRSMEDMSIDG